MLGYLCKTDFECELYGYPRGTVIFNSKAAVLQHVKCASACGIVSFEMVRSPTGELIMSEEDFLAGTGKAYPAFDHPNLTGVRFDAIFNSVVLDGSDEY